VNADIRGVMHKEETVLNTIRKRKLQLFDHISWMPEDRLLKILMLRKVEGSNWKITTKVD